MIMIKITEEWELYTLNFKKCGNNVKMWDGKIDCTMWNFERLSRNWTRTIRESLIQWWIIYTRYITSSAIPMNIFNIPSDRIFLLVQYVNGNSNHLYLCNVRKLLLAEKLRHEKEATKELHRQGFNEGTLCQHQYEYTIFTLVRYPVNSPGELWTSYDIRVLQQVLLTNFSSLPFSMNKALG